MTLLNDSFPWLPRSCLLYTAVLQREQLPAANSCSDVAVSYYSSKYWIEQGTGKSNTKDHSSSLSSRKASCCGNTCLRISVNITSGVVNKILLVVYKHSETRRSS